MEVLCFYVYPHRGIFIIVFWQLLAFIASPTKTQLCFLTYRIEYSLAMFDTILCRPFALSGCPAQWISAVFQGFQ